MFVFLKVCKYSSKEDLIGNVTSLLLELERAALLHVSKLFTYFTGCVLLAVEGSDTC